MAAWRRIEESENGVAGGAGGEMKMAKIFNAIAKIKAAAAAYHQLANGAKIIFKIIMKETASISISGEENRKWRIGGGMKANAPAYRRQRWRK
jgi:hypothetical protein